MKFLFALSIVLMVMGSFAQEHDYTVQGRIANLQSPATVYLTYKKNGGHVYDSVVLKNGRFSFTGKTTEPFFAVLAVDYEGIGILNMDRRSKRDISKSMYVDKGIVNVETNDSLGNAKITGSPLNDDYAAYVAAVEKPFYSQINALQRMKEPDTALISKLQAEQKLAQVKFIKTHSNSYIGMVALTTYGMNGRGESAPEGSVELYRGFSEEIKQTREGQAFQKRIANDSLLAVGKMAPDFSQPGPNGKMVNLRDFRGRYVLIDFWASWCGPCREENPNLVAVYSKYQRHNFIILGVSLDKPGEGDKWKAAIKDDKLTWPQVSDLRGWSNEVVKLYSIMAVPQNFLVEPNGKIVAKNLFGKALDDFLEARLPSSSRRGGREADGVVSRVESNQRHENLNHWSR